MIIVMHLWVVRYSWYWAGFVTVLQPQVETMSSLADFAFDICRSESRDIVVRWLYFFGKFGLHIMMSFGMTLIILQRALGGQH